MANKNKNNEDYESVWDMLLDMGIWKTLALIWGIYTPIYMIAMGILYAVCR